MRWASDHGLFSLPPDEHARVRRLVSAAFTPRAIARMTAQVLEVVRQYAAPLHGRRGTVDLMAEFTDPIPNAVISRVTGVAAPGGEEVRFRELAQATIRGFFTFGDPAARERGGGGVAAPAAGGRPGAHGPRRAPREGPVTR